MKIAIALACLLAAGIAAHSFNEGKSALPVPGSYVKAREKIFSEVSVTLSDNIEENDLVHIVMEKWLDDLIVLLVVKKDGSAWLIDSSGRNIRTPGRHKKQGERCSAYFRDAEKALISTIKTSHNPIPEKGCVMFYFFTVNREYRYENCEEQLQKSEDGGSKLYASAQACLAEVLRVKRKRI